LDQLAEHSLVRVLEQPDGDLRYDMLETIREFGLEQLDTTTDNERQELSQRYERYFAALAQQAGRELQGPDQRRWFAILRRERDNVRATLAGLLERGAGTTAMEIAVAIATFWRSQGYAIEGRLWLERALAAANDAPAALRAAACFEIGIVARSQGDSAEAERVMTTAVSLYREANDQVGLTDAISGLAWNAIYRGEYQRANDLLEYAVSAARSSGNDRLIADMLMDQSVGWATNGEYALAKTSAEESVMRWRALGDRRSLSQALGYLGYIWLWEGDIDRAEQVGRECLTVAEDIEDGLVTFANELLATVALERGHFDQAGQLFRLSLRASQTRQDFMAVIECLEGLAGVAGGYGNGARGAALLGAAEAIRQQYSSPVPPPRQDRYQRTLTVVRSALDPDAFDRAWDQGHLMSPDQAVDYALEPDQPPVAKLQPEAATILSKREREVLRLLVEGKTNQEIATALFISPHTVTNHVTSILTKLNLESRTAAATYALRHGLV
jgi:DNA-binding CsgD family transcriptional regulator